MVDLVTDASDRVRPGCERQSYVVFRLGGEGYALEVMRVQEVLDMQSLTEVPGSPKCLLGVINLRGHVVPVYDLRIPFGLPQRLERRPCTVRLDRRVRAWATTRRSRAFWSTGFPTSSSSLRKKCNPPRNLGLGKATPFVRGLIRHQEAFPARIGSGSGLLDPGSLNGEGV